MNIHNTFVFWRSKEQDPVLLSCRDLTNHKEAEHTVQRALLIYSKCLLMLEKSKCTEKMHDINAVVFFLYNIKI